MAHWHRSRNVAAAFVAVFTASIVLALSAHAVWPGSNGKIVFWKFSGSISAPHTQIYSMDSNGLNQMDLSAAGGGANQLDVQPSVSPNGKRIAFTRVDLSSGTSQIWTMKMNGSDQTNVSHDSDVASESGPSWTEDGSQILFVRQGPNSPPFGGFGSIWIRKANGKGTPHQLTPGPGDANPAMSPDGDLIAFSRAQLDGTRHLILMKSDGSSQTDLGPGSKPDWSPDGERIAYGTGTGFGPITVIEVAEPSQKRVFPGPGSEAPAWSPDGTKIVFIRCAGPMACEIWLMSATFQNPHPITNDVAHGSSDQKPDWQRAHGGGGEGD
jgi:Tol biopolymer transport system component